MYFNFSKLWSFSFKASSISHHKVAYGHIDYCSASTEALQNTMRLLVHRLILLWNLRRKSHILCGKLLFTFVSDSVIQSSWFVITTEYFIISGLTTTWALNLKHFSQCQFLTVVFIAGYYKDKSKTVNITVESTM